MPQSRKVRLFSDGSFGINGGFVEQDMAKNKITILEEMAYVRRARACRPRVTW